MLPYKTAVCAISLGALVSIGITAQSSAGNAERGEAIFADKGNCLSCHRVADRGSYMGPDLSAVGSDHTASILRRAILDPGTEVLPENRLYRITMRSGATHLGRLINQDEYSIQMLDDKSNLLSVSRTDVREADYAPTPPMPSYKDKLTATEQLDLVAYLMTLKGIVKE